MTISPVSKPVSSSGTADLALENQISAIDQKIADVQKKIQDTYQDKNLDAKAKAEKVQGYREQMQEYQLQKREVQVEARKIRQEEAARAREQAQEQGRGELSRDTADRKMPDQKMQEAFASIGSTQKQQHAMAPLRSNMESEMKAAERGSYTRPADPAKASELRARITDIDSHTMKATKETMDKAQEMRASEEDEEKQGSGTGRREVGQFMDEEV